jgi:hypothetical protein
VDLHGDDELVLCSTSDESGDSKGCIRVSYSLRSAALGLGSIGEDASLEVDGRGGSLSTGFGKHCSLGAGRGGGVG